MDKSFCALPWISIATDTTGNVVPCCVSRQKIRKNETNYNLGFDDIHEIYNSKDFVELRRAMLAGELPSGCEECIDCEKYGGISLRQQINSMFTVDDPKEIVEIKPRYMDVRPGNTCNLRCRSCAPFASSQLAKEVESLRKYGISEFHGEYYPPDDIWYNTETFHKNIDFALDTIEEIYLTGGEPSIIQHNIDTLTKLVETGKSKNITISISTNLTNSNYKFFTLLKNFKLVKVYASLDGYRDMQEYLRYPSNWSRIADNLTYISKLDNVEILVTPVIQITNLNKILDLFKFIKELNETANKKINVFPINLENPDYLNMLYLPKAYKVKCYDEIMSWVNTHQPGLGSYLDFIGNKANEDVDYQIMLDKFTRYNRLLDTNRGVSLESVNPELVELLKEENLWQTSPTLD